MSSLNSLRSGLSSRAPMFDLGCPILRAWERLSRWALGGLVIGTFGIALSAGCGLDGDGSCLSCDGVSTELASPSAPVADTAVGRLLKEWLAAYNSGDAKKDRGLRRAALRTERAGRAHAAGDRSAGAELARAGRGLLDRAHRGSDGAAGDGAAARVERAGLRAPGDPGRPQGAGDHHGAQPEPDRGTVRITSRRRGGRGGSRSPRAGRARTHSGVRDPARGTACSPAARRR